jgi:hypothetical protein
MSGYYVVDQDMVEIGMARPNIIEQLDQATPVPDLKPALTFIAVGTDDRQIVQLRIGRYRSGLIFDRVPLVIRGRTEQRVASFGSSLVEYWRGPRVH